MKVENIIFTNKKGDHFEVNVPVCDRDEYIIDSNATVGVELEVLFAQKQFLRFPTAQQMKSILGLEKEHPNNIGEELLADTVEFKSLPFADISETVDDLKEIMRKGVAKVQDLLPIPFSIHPLLAASNLSYNKFIQQIVGEKHGYGGSELDSACSLQVNIQVSEGNALLFVHNALRRCLHPLIVLTANSCFHNCRPSGLLGMRHNLRAIALDSGHLPEDIRESDWTSYFARRAKMCRIGTVYAFPWRHNFLLRMRPDRNCCIEIGAADVITNFDIMAAYIDLLRCLVTRCLQAYKNGEDLPGSVFGPSDHMGIIKNVQEAVIRGRESMFLDGNLELMSARQALLELFNFANEAASETFHQSYAKLMTVLENGSPAEILMAEFNNKHPNCTDRHCQQCRKLVREITEREASRFYNRIFS